MSTGKVMYYRQNWQGPRTAFIALLAQGARFYGDEGCDGIQHVYYAGFELPEFDSTGARNWKFHPGNMVARPTYKPVTAINTGTNALTVAAHGYATDTTVEVFSQGGALPPELEEGVTYYAINDGTNSLKLSATLGGGAIDLSTAGTGSIFVFANANVGFNDPVQGNSYFFPGLKWAGAGIAWIEVLLPAELSDGENEPSRLKVIMRGKRVRDYTRVGTALVAGDFLYSTNNALVLLDIYTGDLKRPLSRFHAVTWVDEFKPRCDALIDWEGGNEGTDAMTWLGVSNFTFDELGGLSKSTSNAWDASAASISFPAGTKIKIKVKAGLGTFGFGISGAATDGPTPDDLIFSLQANTASNVLTQKGSGVVHELGSWAVGDSLEIEIVEEGAGVAFTARQNGNTLPLITIPAVPASDLFVVFLGFTNGAGCDEAKITPAGTDANIRQVKRFTANVAFPSLTQANEAASQVWLRAPGCGYQDVNGVIKAVSTPDRAIFAKKLLFDPSSGQKSNVLEFSAAPRRADDKFNFFPYLFRNQDSPLLLKGPPVTVDRSTLRERFGLKEQPVLNLLVMTQSLCERMGETFARLDVDLEPFYMVEASFDMYGLAKEDFCYVAEITAGLSNAAPALAMVIEERFKFDGVETRSFVLQAISPDFYSDTAHGPITALLPSQVISPFAPPPALSDLVLAQSTDDQADGSAIVTIRGTATFEPFNRQLARVYWWRPTDADYLPTQIVLRPAASMIASFIIDNVAPGLHKFKVITETETGVVSLAEKLEEIDVEFIDPLAPTDLIATPDNSEDWHISVVGHPRQGELQEYVARVRRFSDGVLMRDIPLYPESVSMAAMFEAGSGALVTNNNLYPDGFARSIQTIDGPGAYIDFIASIQNFATNLNLQFIPATLTPWENLFSSVAGILIQSGDLTHDPLFIVTGWLGETLFSGRLKSPAKIRISFVGTEVRFYTDWQGTGTKPKAVSGVPPTFPLRIRSYVRTGSKIENVIIGGLAKPQTIYSKRQQRVDSLANGGPDAALDDITVEVWQKSRVTGRQGLSVGPTRFNY